MSTLSQYQTTRAQKRKAKKDLESKLCLMAFMSMATRIEKFPERLQRRVIAALTAIYSP